MLKKFAIIFEYITMLYKSNIELQKSSNSIFRIIKTERDENGNNIINVQVINKATIFRCNVKEIVAQDKILECFSKNDVRIITYLSTEELFRPKNKIVGLEYNEESGRTIVKIQVDGADQVSVLTADQIAINKDLIKNLSQEDAHRAGYLMAIEETILEKKAIERRNSHNIDK